MPKKYLEDKKKVLALCNVSVDLDFTIFSNHPPISLLYIKSHGIKYILYKISFNYFYIQCIYIIQ